MRQELDFDADIWEMYIEELKEDREETWNELGCHCVVVEMGVGYEEFIN